MILARKVVSEVDLHNAGAYGVDLNLPAGATVVAVEHALGWSWYVTYYTHDARL